MKTLRLLLTLVIVAAFPLWGYAISKAHSLYGMNLVGAIFGGVLLLAGLLVVALLSRPLESKGARISQIALAVVVWLFAGGMKFEEQGWYYWLFIAALVAALLRVLTYREHSHGPSRTDDSPVRTRPAHEEQKRMASARPIGKGWVYGFAGGNISSGNAGFGEEQVRAGTKGEEAVGALLEKYAAQYGGVVVHGLRFDPNNYRSKADVDHAFIVEDHKMFLIDAKMWAGGEYEWRDYETLWRDGAPFKGGTVHMEDADAKWESAFGRHMGNDISTFIVMALRGKDRYRVKSLIAHNGQVALMSLYDFERYLRDNPPRPINDWSLANRVVESML